MNLTLDDIRRIDRRNMYEAVLGVPRQWQEGRRRALEADLGGVPGDGYRHVVVAGMGGSAIGGALLQALALDEAAAPVFVSRSYRLPAWVGRETVVVASSYSGDTEETLAAMDLALRRGAPVVCVTTGGAMLDRAHREGIPVVQIPGGLQPRAALGYSLTALLTVAERLRLLTLGAGPWDETRALLERQARELGDPATPGNPAMDLARTLRDTWPCIYSSEGLLEAVNLRWRNQIHENSKTPAVGNVFPELNHNEIMGWERETDGLARLGVVVLRDREDHPRVQRRMDVTRALLADRVGSWTELQSRGTSKLARVLSLVYLGDWVSLYLAMLHQTDPTPIPLIDRLKDALARS